LYKIVQEADPTKKGKLLSNLSFFIYTLKVQKASQTSTPTSDDNVRKYKTMKHDTCVACLLLVTIFAAGGSW
jgi:hypothetical protein